MKRMNLVILCSAYLFSPSMLYAKTLNTQSKFTDYPVQIYKGPTAQLDKSDADARLFRTQLSEGLKENLTMLENMSQLVGVVVRCVST